MASLTKMFTRFFKKKKLSSNDVGRENLSTKGLKSIKIDENLWMKLRNLVEDKLTKSSDLSVENYDILL